MGEGQTVKWWGWGTEDKFESLGNRPVLLDHLRQQMHISTLRPRGVVRFEDIAIAPRD